MYKVREGRARLGDRRGVTAPVSSFGRVRVGDANVGQQEGVSHEDGSDLARVDGAMYRNVNASSRANEKEEESSECACDKQSCF